MGKGKNKKMQIQQNEGHQDNASSEQQQQKEEDNNKNEATGSIVLGVYIHCEGCGDKVIKCLREFEGVEGVEIDAKNHKVTVKGKKADPTRVAERLRKKSGKHVELVSPKPKPKPNPNPKKEEMKEEKKAQPKVIEVVLRMYLHCERCAKEVKHYLHKMEGVQTVDPDMAKNQVTVKGTMDAKKLVEFINKRSGRNAEILKQSDTNTNKQANKVEKNKNESTVHNYPNQELVHAPQLLSDENPNACSVM